MPCPHCGNEIPVNAHFCQHCGAALPPKPKSNSTLIILLVVIPIVLLFIIGILAAIAIPTFIGKANRARQVVDDAAINNVNSAAEMYYIDHGVYPPNLEAVTRDIQPPPQWKYYNRFVFDGKTLKGYKD